MAKTFKYLKIIMVMLVLTTGIVFFSGFSHTVSKGEKFDVKLLSAFTTEFDGNNKARSHNIRLASELINGSTVRCGETFSFNAAVGQRTPERGFKRAAIIKDGEYVAGYGGGVCQVSTTLYNAALLSGCKISEYHAHSLPVSYVPPSRDAMVSGTDFDLKFVNTTGSLIYITSSFNGGSVTFKIYGRDFGARYSCSSRVTGIITAPEEFTDNEQMVRDGKDGIISEGYITVTRNGISHSKLLRRDKYAPQKKISLKPEELPPEISENI